MYFAYLQQQSVTLPYFYDFFFTEVNITYVRKLSYYEYFNIITSILNIIT